MRKYASLVIILIIALGLFSSNASSQAGKAKGKAKPQASQDVGKDKAAPRRTAKRPDREQGWERRDGFDLRTYTGKGRPPGWNRGKKTGWENCGVPPGQAKKGACRTYAYSGHRYFYHYGDDGRMVVRRVAVHVTVR